MKSKLLIGSLLVAAGSVVGISSQAFAESAFSVPPGYFEQHGPVANSYGVAGAPANPFSTFLDGVRCEYEYRSVGNGDTVRVKICG